MTESPLFTQLQNEIEKGIAVLVIQSGGRLIHNQELYILRQRLGNLDQLLFSHAQILTRRVGIFR